MHTMFAHKPISHHTQVRCLDYALANGADITLNSYGGLYADSAALKTAIAVAEGHGQLFVTAAGNDYGAGLHLSTNSAHDRTLPAASMYNYGLILLLPSAHTAAGGSPGQSVTLPVYAWHGVSTGT